MNKHRLERVLVVNEAFELRGLITVKDILKSHEHPFASKDAQGKLIVGAAVGSGSEGAARYRLAVACGSSLGLGQTVAGRSAADPHKQRKGSS